MTGTENFEKKSISEELGFEKGKVLTKAQQEEYKEEKRRRSATPLDSDFSREKILQMVKNKEDLQKLRIGVGNRICASYMRQFGIKPGEKKDEDAELDKVLKKLCSEYDRITDAYIQNGSSAKKEIRNLQEAGQLQYILDMIDYNLIDSYVKILEAEEKNRKALCDEVESHPVYGFFEEVRGVGPEMAAVCLALFNPYKARHVANFWSFAGLNPVTVLKEKKEKGKTVLDENGDPIIEEKVIGNCKQYLETSECLSKDGKVIEKRGITYNPFLKTQLLGVMASNIIKSSIKKIYVTDDNGNWLDKDGNITTNKSKRVDSGYRQAVGKYANVYMDFKRRKLNDGQGRPASQVEAMAKRAMIKEVVKDLWIYWRTYLGLPVTTPYEIEFLGRAPHKWPNLEEYNLAEFKRGNAEDDISEED